MKRTCTWFWLLSLLLVPHLAIAQVDGFGNPTTEKLRMSPDLLNNIEAGELVTFTASGGTGNYTWEVFTGDLSSTQGDTVIYIAPRCACGCQDVVTVLDSSGQSEAAEIKINEPPACIITPETVKLSPGEEQQFTVTHVEGSVSWTASSGEIIERGTQATYTAPDTAGTYSITATEINPPYCEARASIEVEKYCYITPKKVTLPPGGQQQFEIAGTDCGNFNWIATVGDIIADTGMYTAPNIPGSYEVEAFDNVGNKQIADVEVISLLSVSPSEIFLQPGGYEYITVVTGKPNYHATATKGNITPTENSKVFKFTASSELGEVIVEICDDTQACKTVSVYINKLSLTGLPIEVEIDKEYQITVSGGQPNYDLRVEYGQILDIDQHTGEMTYKAPDSDRTNEMITIEDQLGNRLVYPFEVKGYVTPYISPSVGVDLGFGEIKKFSVAGGTGPFLWKFTGNPVKEIDEQSIEITAPDKVGVYALSVTDAKKSVSEIVPVDVNLSLKLTPPSYTIYKGESPKVRIEKLGGDDYHCEWILNDLEESEIHQRSFNYVIVQPRVKDVPVGKQYQVTCRDDTRGEEASSIITVSKLKFDSDTDGSIDENEVSRALEGFFVDGELDKTMLFSHLEAFLGQ